jgi:exopolysaccharide biosynthesis polyprenyl glycosylphosphotransferase
VTALLPEGEVRLEANLLSGERLGRSPPHGPPPFSDGGPQNRKPYITLCEVSDAAIAPVGILVAFFLTNLGHMPAALEGWLTMRITLDNVLLLALFLLLWRSSFGVCGLYDWRRLINRSEELSSAIAATTLGSSFTLLFVLHSSGGGFDARAVVYFWLAATGLVLILRSILRTLAFNSPSPATREVIIVGSGPRAASLYRQLSGDRRAGYNVLGFVDSNEAVASEEIDHQLLGKLDQLESILMRQALDEVVIALPMRSCYGAIHSAIQTCERVGVRAKYLADVFPASLATPRFEAARDFPAVAMAVAPEDGRLIVKRLIDIIGSIVALAVLAPVMLVAALAIKLTSPGSVIFAQERLGLNKRRFRMYKFRTMIANAEACQAALEHLNEAPGPVFKIRNDPRITPLGKFLRRTSIDELPQLFNVLRGEMSLVGPRPLPLRDVAKFTEGARMRRFSMRPGLTCFWQIQGRSELSFEDWMRLDLEYIDHWSLALDLLILLRTVPAVVLGTGAA